MPVITMESSKLNKDPKAQLVKAFTESAAKIMNMPSEAFSIYLKENELDNIGFGGKLLSDIRKK